MTQPLADTDAPADFAPLEPQSSRMTMRRTSQGKIIGRHASVRAALATIESVAPKRCNVLVTGESGTGKELVVAALHDASERSRGPLVSVNCGAIPENLLENELFGHTRGAYTGAVAARVGFVGAAEAGTLFLDEIGELPLSMQVKILRLLSKHEYTPVGESRPQPCDIRVVAATHRDLEREVKEGRFREDLYYRLNVVHVHMPPLRERGGDVETLALYFLQHCASRVERAGLAGYAPEALAALRAWRWPGNIRELENCVERAVLLTRGPLVTVSDFPRQIREHYEGVGARAALRSGAAVPATPAASSSVALVPVELPDEGLDLRAAVEEYRNTLVRQAMERTGGNRKKAAELLRINRTTLVEMLRRVPA